MSSHCSVCSCASSAHVSQLHLAAAAGQRHLTHLDAVLPAGDHHQVMAASQPLQVIAGLCGVTSSVSASAPPRVEEPTGATSTCYRQHAVCKAPGEEEGVHDLVGLLLQRSSAVSTGRVQAERLPALLAHLAALPYSGKVVDRVGVQVVVPALPLTHVGVQGVQEAAQHLFTHTRVSTEWCWTSHRLPESARQSRQCLTLSRHSCVHKKQGARHQTVQQDSNGPSSCTLLHSQVQLALTLIDVHSHREAPAARRGSGLAVVGVSSALWNFSCCSSGCSCPLQPAALSPGCDTGSLCCCWHDLGVAVGDGRM